MSYVDRLVGAMCVVALAGAPACGSDEEPVADTGAAATQVDGDTAPARSADMTIVALCDPLDAITADNVYDGEILSVRAQNGWTIDVMAFEGDPPDHADAPEVITPIANAALGLISQT